MGTTHPLDAALAFTGEAGRWQGHTRPEWANMVGPFGGITAAQALAAVLREPGLLGEPVSLTINYAAALADGPFEVLVRAARTNRSTQHWVVEVQQGGQAVLTGTVFTAVRRSTWNASESPMPEVPRPLDTPPAGGPKRVVWVDRYDMRFVKGAFPGLWDGADQGDSTSRLWLRDQPPRPLDFPALAAMCDVFYPRIWRRRAQPVPVGTVSMTVYFLATAADLAEAGTGFVLGQAHAHAFHAGYFDQSARMWSEAGRLLATTHQVVYYKE